MRLAGRGGDTLGRVIPTMWLFGGVIGRWWAVPLGAVIWVLLVAFAVEINADGLPVVAALGAVNTAVGVLVRQGVGAVARLLGRLGRPARA